MNFEPEQCCLTKMDASEDARYADTISFLRSDKHTSSLDRSSGAYNYKKVIDQLCIEMATDWSFLHTNGMQYSISCTPATAAWQRHTKLSYSYTTDQI